MKTLKRVTIGIMVLVLVLGILVASRFICDGYQLYQNALKQQDLESKVNEIRQSSNYTTIDEMPEMYLKAVIAAEDHRFQYHNGIDVIAIVRSTWNNLVAGSIQEGGSTITQQLAKNLYFTQEKQFTRKIAEMFMAFRIERTYTKTEILELYVNSIYFGDGYYCVRDASQGYFGIDPAEMTDYQSTLLAGIPNAPSIYSLSKNPQLAKQRQKEVIRKMLEQEYITEDEAQAILNGS